MTNLVWEIPKNILNETAKTLASKRSEVFVLWTAPLNLTNNVCKISRHIVPEQDSHSGWEGAYVHIEGTELSRIVFDNYSRNERSVIQIHTHPSEDVEMSLLDREWEVVKHVGALSIIVPSYGKYGLDEFHGVNVYEREEDDWRLWTRDEISKRFKII
jgi:hypothetical protein